MIELEKLKELNEMEEMELQGGTARVVKNDSDVTSFWDTFFSDLFGNLFT